ncbi:MAG: hypothetical protein JRF64_03455 [Deltaproteobacteria bacterium]|nr:hypothetical protein [Deltaproteobacteria bacterium]
MKQSVSCKSYIHLFSLIWLFWLFSGYSTGYASPDESSISLSGFMELRYDGRYLSEDSGEDHKLHQIVDISIKENEWGHFRFNLCGDMTEDLDGEADDDEVDRTRTIRDTWDSSTIGFLYVCQAEIYQLGPIDYARFGRQYVNHELGTTHVDGFNCLFKFDFFSKRIKPFAYGGIPVRLYEDGEYWDAREVGGGAHLFWDRWTRITLEHQLIEEEPDITGTYGESGESRYEQSACAIRRSLFQKGHGSVSLFLLDNSPKRVNSTFSILIDKPDLGIDASYSYQFEEIDQTPTAIFPYTGLVGPIKPYHNATIDIMTGIYKDSVWLSGGTEWRLLDSGEEESEFNHSYNREYLALIVEDLPMKGIELSLQADYWQVMDDSNEDSILTFTGGIGYEKREQIRLFLGSSYSLYSYDYFADPEEKTDVYTVHSDVRCYLQPGLYFDARYELDIYDINEHRFVVTVGIEI